MHKYDLLEKIYYKKLYTKYIIYFTIFIALIIISVIGIKLYTSKKSHTIHKNDQQKLFLKPIEPQISLNFDNEEDTQQISQNNYKPQPTKPVSQPPQIQQPIKTYSPPSPKPQIITQTYNQQPTTSNNTPIIKIEKKDVNQILLIQHFNKNPNYIDAINLAKYFYKRNDYKQTIKWALKANELNPEKYGSWLYYAKALKAQYKLKEAREVLKSYLDNYGPNEAIENELKGIK